MKEPKPPTNPLAVAAAIVVLVVVFFTFVWQPRRHDGAPRVWCASNLKQIGQAILLYANENKGATPDTFVTALRTQDLVPDVFVCRSTATERAESADAFAADPGPRHCDYVYVGDRLPLPYEKAPADAVLAFDRPANHDREGVNILFGDGHVEFMPFSPREAPTPWLDNVQAQIARGDRPVVMRATPPR